MLALGQNGSESYDRLVSMGDTTVNRVVEQSGPLGGVPHATSTPTTSTPMKRMPAL